MTHLEVKPWEQFRAPIQAVVVGYCGKGGGEFPWFSSLLVACGSGKRGRLRRVCNLVRACGVAELQKEVRCSQILGWRLRPWSWTRCIEPDESAL